MRAIVLGLAMLIIAGTACTSSPNDAIVRLPMIEAGAEKTPPPTAIDPGPSLDTRDESDNLLANLELLRDNSRDLEERLATAQLELEKERKRAQIANETERSANTELSDLRDMLDASTTREQEFQRQVILARLDALKKQRELIQREIDSLSAGQDP